MELAVLCTVSQRPCFAAGLCQPLLSCQYAVHWLTFPIFCPAVLHICCGSTATHNQQTQLVRDMAEVGEAALAHEYRKQLQLPESVLKVDPAAIAAQEEARRQQYMQLELPQGSLLFVDDEATLLQAAQLLAGSDVVGLDVEWKPSHMAGEASPAALLQVRRRQHAVPVYVDAVQEWMNE